jgi:hypothetical protein
MFVCAWGNSNIFSPPLAQNHPGQFSLPEECLQLFVLEDRALARTASGTLAVLANGRSKCLAQGVTHLAAC